MSRFSWNEFELRVTVYLPEEDLESVTAALTEIAIAQGWCVTIGVIEHTTTA